MLPLILGALSCSGPTPEEELVGAVHQSLGARTHSVEVIVVVGEGSCLACSGQLIRMIEERSALPGLVIVNFASTAVLDVSGVMKSRGYIDGDELDMGVADVRTRSRLIFLRNGRIERCLEVRAQDMDMITTDLSEMLLELERTT